MNTWILRIELDGEWEECSFATPKEALCAFAALVKDYERNLSRAVLCSESAAARSRLGWMEPKRHYVN
ncbi:MAG: hypothetical protein ACRD4O_09075 [Bryobacteraceae bacterium]